ncbi:MAG: hypothetical protein ACJAW3_000647 [Lentimonas sp.]|jgi:hypothetical protein
MQFQQFNQPILNPETPYRRFRKSLFMVGSSYLKQDFLSGNFLNLNENPTIFLKGFNDRMEKSLDHLKQITTLDAQELSAVEESLDQLGNDLISGVNNFLETWMYCFLGANSKTDFQKNKTVDSLRFTFEILIKSHKLADGTYLLKKSEMNNFKDKVEKLKRKIAFKPRQTKTKIQELLDKMNLISANSPEFTASFQAVINSLTKYKDENISQTIKECSKSIDEIHNQFEPIAKLLQNYRLMTIFLLNIKTLNAPLKKSLPNENIDFTEEKIPKKPPIKKKPQFKTTQLKTPKPNSNQQDLALSSPTTFTLAPGDDHGFILVSSKRKPTTSKNPEETSKNLENQKASTNKNTPQKQHLADEKLSTTSSEDPKSTISPTSDAQTPSPKPETRPQNHYPQQPALPNLEQQKPLQFLDFYQETREWAYYPNNDSETTLQLFIKQKERYFAAPSRYVKDVISGNFHELSEVFGHTPNIYAHDRTGSVVEIKPTKIEITTLHSQSQKTTHSH